jgi:hypothetical protein
MSPYTRAALFVIRMIAFGCILFTVVYFGLYFMATKVNKKPSEGPPSLVLKGMPLLVGLVLWAKSYAIAKRVTEDLDD